MSITIYQTGKVKCIREPRGDAGLEGFTLGSEYEFKRVTDTGMSIWYQICPDPRMPKYLERCDPPDFKKYFEIIESENKEL